MKHSYAVNTQQTRITMCIGVWQGQTGSAEFKVQGSKFKVDDRLTGAMTMKSEMWMDCHNSSKLYFNRRYL